MGLLLLELHPGRAVVRDAPTVFPVWSGAALTSRGYDLSAADLTVEERLGDAADEFVVTNNGRRGTMVLKGGLLEGGQQVRVAARPMLSRARRRSCGGRTSTKDMPTSSTQVGVNFATPYGCSIGASRTASSSALSVSEGAAATELPRHPPVARAATCRADVRQPRRSCRPPR